MCKNVYSNNMDVLYNFMMFSNRQKLETIKMSLNNEYISTKINKLELFATTWKNLTMTRLSERIQAQEEIYCIISFISTLKK